VRAEVRAADSADGGEGEARAGVEVVRLTGMRATIAERMARSLREAPQLTLTTAVDVTELVALRRRLEAEFPVTVNDLVLAATVRALVAHPREHLVGDEVRISRRVHLGLAVAVEDGLVVPVIRDAGSLGLRELAARARDLGERARTGSLGVEDVSGGTFTVTNLGALGIDTFTPILNPPQVGILGVGRSLTMGGRRGGAGAGRAEPVSHLRSPRARRRTGGAVPGRGGTPAGRGGFEPVRGAALTRSHGGNVPSPDDDPGRLVTMGLDDA
jgi:pyruvate/2-oxoglutarate dehydrogenase complex dihydrolipoamide acyltransferase (E2) component